MIKTEFMELYETLSELNEAKVDVDRFVDKFGQDTYDLFKKSSQRLKNAGVSTDLTYHIKNTEKKDLDTILYNLKNRIVTKSGDLTSMEGDYEYLGEAKGYKVYKINDVVASMNLGAGTGWCISGRYNHYGEKTYTPTREEAEKHWNDYASKGVTFYFFIGKQDKYALAKYPKIFRLTRPLIAPEGDRILRANFELYNERDILAYEASDVLPLELTKLDLTVDSKAPIKIIIPAGTKEITQELTNALKVDSDGYYNVVIPEGVTTIGSAAFSEWSTLAAITIPVSVTEIKDEAFFLCSDLRTVNYLGTEEQWGKIKIGAWGPLANSRISEFRVNGKRHSGTLQPPDGLTELNAWNNPLGGYLKKLIVPDSVKSISILYAPDLSEVVFGSNSSLEVISERTFSGLNLKNLTLPKSLRVIEPYAFSSCEQLETITFEEGSQLEHIGEAAFYGCKSLATINNLPNTVQVELHAFDRCTKLDKTFRKNIYKNSR
jgi:hypothetical protein